MAEIDGSLEAYQGFVVNVYTEGRPDRLFWFHIKLFMVIVLFLFAMTPIPRH